jgi:hypothetical protein
MQALISLWMIGMLVVVLLSAYVLPTLIAWLRHAPDRAAVTLLNLALGWTVIGWIAALVLALRKPASPVVQVISQLNAPPASGYFWGLHPGQGLPPGQYPAVPPDGHLNRSSKGPYDHDA